MAKQNLEYKENEYYLIWVSCQTFPNLLGWQGYPSLVFNRPSVARLFYKHLSHYSVISLGRWSFASKSWRHLHSQTVWARDLTFWVTSHILSCITCHMSRVTCHVTHVTCHMSHVTCCVSHVVIFFLLFFLWIKFGGISWLEGLIKLGPTPSSLLQEKEKVYPLMNTFQRYI